MDHRSFVEQAVKAGIESYPNSRQHRISPFIEENFSLKGARQISKPAFGKILLRAQHSGKLIKAAVRQLWMA
jgi:hypothetical protein